MLKRNIHIPLMEVVTASRSSHLGLDAGRYHIEFRVLFAPWAFLGHPKQRKSISNGIDAWVSGPCECGDPVEPGQLVRVGDDVDADDPTVLDGEAHRGGLTADVDPDGG